MLDFTEWLMVPQVLLRQMENEISLEESRQETGEWWMETVLERASKTAVTSFVILDLACAPYLLELFSLNSVFLMG